MTPTPISQILETLTSAVKKLGPERSQSALKGYDEGGHGTGWAGCVLARAYGAFGQLVVDADRWAHENKIIVGISSPYLAFAQIALGLTLAEVQITVGAYDRFFNATRGFDAYGLLHALLKEEASKTTISMPMPMATTDGQSYVVYGDGELTLPGATFFADGLTDAVSLVLAKLAT